MRTSLFRSRIALFTVLLFVPIAAGAAPPKVTDPRLTIELFAESPDIKTPIGIAVDRKGRVFVVESHTHERPSGYEGPATDRIRVFEDTHGAGKADKIETVFEGTHSTMCLAFAPDGALYVSTRSEVFKLSPKNGADGPLTRTPILRLDTPGNYPHNGLDGMAFDFHGDLYVGLGENLGAPYKLIGSDGSTLSGGGEGGNFFRCHADGSHVERFATGFWNPFQCCFDVYGRLFTVDNDPDSRPPCRLLHVVEGGDYGYRFRYGRKGTHPFVAWNGELPGTLPMASAVGEAPSGLVAYESDGLPAEYRGELLATSWGDHRIDRFTLSEHGATAWAKMTPLVTGGEDFRPVSIAVAPDGSLFVSDWVSHSYAVHGKGRIWHIKSVGPASSKTASSAPERAADRTVRESATRKLAADEPGRAVLRKLADKDADERLRATAVAALADVADEKTDFVAIAMHDRSPLIRELAVRCMPFSQCGAVELFSTTQPAGARAAAFRRLLSSKHFLEALDALDEKDPFLQEAARQALGYCGDQLEEPTLAKLSASKRLGILLTLRATREKQSRSRLPGWLADADPDIKFAAIEWIGESRLTEYRPLIEKLLAGEANTRPLFEACVAALELIDGKQQPDVFHGDEYVVKTLENPASTPAMLGLALQMLPADHAALTVPRWKRLLASDSDSVRLEAVRSLRMSPAPERLNLLNSLAADAKASADLRAAAIVGLAGDDSQRTALVNLATSDGPGVVREEALRALRGATLPDAELAALLNLKVRAGSERFTELVDRINAKPVPDPAPHDVDAWLKKLEGPADPVAGERIFFHPKAAGCYKCHQMHGRGGVVGPDLTTAAKELTRQKLVESIVDPSKEIAPRFAPWSLVLKDGRSMTGQLVTEGPGDLETYADATGKLFTLSPAQIDERTPLDKSIMPEGLADQMTLQEFRDLVAFLLQAANSRE